MTTASEYELIIITVSTMTKRNTMLWKFVDVAARSVVFTFALAIY